MAQSKDDSSGDAAATDNPLARHGKVSYLEIPAVDARRAAAFYNAVFSWNIRGNPDSPSFTDPSGQLIGRWHADRPIAATPGFGIYLYVVGIDASLAHVRDQGVTFLTEPREQGDIWIATIKDTEGNHLGIWQFSPR